MKTPEYVLLATERFDPTADCVIDYLSRRGVAYLRFNVDFYPAESTLTMEIANGQLEGRISADGRTVDLGEIKSAWYRSLNPAGFPEDLAGAERKFAKVESQAALAGLAKISAWRWINLPESDRMASSKPAQLMTARAVGLDTPRTLISNDPHEIRDFYNVCGGRIIYKAFSQPLDLSPGEGIFAGMLTQEHLDSLPAVRYTPGIFQEYVDKELELRITVVGGKIFPVAIHSQDDAQAKVDWRAHPNPSALKHEPYPLPEGITERLFQLVRRFGLVYSAIDMVVAPDGRFVFLESNPSGQYGWIEAVTGLPITEALVDELTSS